MIARTGAIVALMALSACTYDVAEMTCDQIEAEVVALSEGQLIKITNAHETERTPTGLTCYGNGFYDTGETVLTRYRAWLDEDGEIMVAYDTDEAFDMMKERYMEQVRQDEKRQIREMERQIDDPFAADAQDSF